ncbi:MAG: dihydroxyacetone kinase subunit L [Dorea sp.]|jgi:dihydroxyacetone kinase-like protein|nr:dihydroxyacetone kinase subunit L [Dorea sp.]
MEKNLYDLIIHIADAMIEAEPLLTEYDSALGDGDCGQGMKAGFTAVKQSINKEDSPRDLLKKTAMAMISAIGGTSGAIYGTAFMKLSGTIGQAETIDQTVICEALVHALEGAKMRGEGTVVGDKTLVDALEPAVYAFKDAMEAGKSYKEAAVCAREAAEKGSESTIQMTARKGRASYLGERSVGHRDAGSYGIAVLCRAAEQYLNH